MYCYILPALLLRGLSGAVVVSASCIDYSDFCWRLFLSHWKGGGSWKGGRRSVVLSGCDCTFWHDSDSNSMWFKSVLHVIYIGRGGIL